MNLQSILIFTMALLVFPRFASAQTNSGYETERQRLQMVRKIIASEATQRAGDMNNQYRQLGTTAPTCEVMLQDLLAGKFKAIEPVQIRAKHDPTYFEQRQNPKTNQVQALRGFPKATTDKLRFCAGPEHLEKIQGVEDRFFLGFDDLAGESPFRVYRLPDSANPYRDADFVFWSAMDTALGIGWRYSWVKLDTCKEVFRSQTSASTDQEKRSPGGNAQAIALYRGKFTYLEAYKGIEFSIQHLEPDSIRSKTLRRLGTHCNWATFTAPNSPLIK